MIDLVGQWPLIAGGIIRSILGWLENSLADGKIEPFELKQLGGTIIRVGTLALALSAGLGIDPTTAAGAGIGADFLLKALKK